MAVWKIDVPVTGSMTVEVRADTEAEARQLLEEGEYEPTVDLCTQCSGYSTYTMRFPVRFSLNLDQVEVSKFNAFAKEG